MSGVLRGRFWDQLCLTSLSVTSAVGLSAPSASLLTTPSRVVRSTHRKGGMPSRGTGLRGGPFEQAALVEDVPAMAGMLKLDGLQGSFQSKPVFGSMTIKDRVAKLHL